MKQFDKPAAKSEKKAKNSAFAREMQNKLRKKRGEPLLPLDPDETIVEEDPDEEVRLSPHLFWVWQAFAILSRTRMVNQAGPQPILLTEIIAYCELEGLSAEWQQQELLHHITTLDIEWLRISHSEIEKSREETKKQAEKEAKNRKRGR